MMDGFGLLTPDEAAPHAGVPAEQLRRWAGWGVGPRNSGSRGRPKYREEDLREWRDEIQGNVCGGQVDRVR